jgi:hypothetical protein
MTSPKKEKTPDKDKRDALMKYFIIQSMSSSILIFIVVFLSQEELINQEALNILLTVILMLKTAVSPLHA